MDMRKGSARKEEGTDSCDIQKLENGYYGNWEGVNILTSCMMQIGRATHRFN